MFIEETLTTLLSTIGNTYLLEKAEGDTNCIVYKKISTNIGRTHNKTSSIDKYRFQIDCYGLSFEESRNLANSVITKLDTNTTDFKTSLLNNDFYTKEIDTNLYRSILEFFIWN